MIGAILLVLIGLCWMLGSLRPTPAGWPAQRWRGLVGLLFFVIGVLVITVGAHAATPTTVTSAPTRITVPDVNARLRLLVEQTATEEWGVDASPARLAAQLHQESSWNPRARSVVGAEGLAQFMPTTGRWLAQQFPELGDYDPWDPAWSAHAAAVYDHWLLVRNPGAGQCSSWAFAFSAYNGGERMLHREQAVATQHGHDGQRWFGHVADYRTRAPEAWRENRDYVRRILVVLEPAYIAAGWPGQAVCA
jgi:soluble lytic murein transglycosylase-like protein